ncbi:uncharacterized protein EDB91DRAFT_1250857 [Suillus paluster]|uniref:uncharacterized protein n=1 Tax=Suillus paluster TaxID=48578 RepID=UPI001B86A479|nr:uncharacterized protein EDB91DRAFT_1250857 [Suillus paluster]KAG1734740.1 hypothetical protein EDB91DRAFT_1250857 [Suillus paluster]
MITVLGDALAFYAIVVDTPRWPRYPYWSLHVCNWHQSGPAVLDTCVSDESYDLVDVRFLTEEKLLTLTPRGQGLYNVEDLSKAPQLQARFMMPIIGPIWSFLEDPALLLSIGFPYVISARLFFMDIPATWFDATSDVERVVPWLLWGPQNSRCFDSSRLDFQFGVGRTRVVRSVPLQDLDEFWVHMNDFNPSAVARGIGKVVREPTVPAGFREHVVTYLHYVEVVNLRICPRFVRITLDEERLLYSPSINTNHEVGVFRMSSDHLFDYEQGIDIAIIDM